MLCAEGVGREERRCASGGGRRYDKYVFAKLNLAKMHTMVPKLRGDLRDQ
jgi:hypothetical protein